MTNKEILQADVLDILFEHRNKLYGAYALRKTYSNRLGMALAAAISTVLIFAVISFIKESNNNNKPDDINNQFVITEVNIEKEKPREPEKPKETPKPEQKVAQADYDKIIVVPDNMADTLLPTTDDLQNVVIGHKNVESDYYDDRVKPSDENNDTGNGTEKEAEPQKEFKIDEKQPSFPGSTDAWRTFLQRYLQTPDDLEPGERIEVQVRFLVDLDGSISKLEIIKSGGSLFDKEVLRVLKKMPRWEPAIQNGHNVVVAYTQPVIFMGVEE